MTNKTFSIVLDDDILKKLDEIAATKGVARNKILVQLVERYVADNYDKAQKAREAEKAAAAARALIE